MPSRRKRHAEAQAAGGSAVSEAGAPCTGCTVVATGSASKQARCMSTAGVPSSSSSCTGKAAWDGSAGGNRARVWPQAWQRELLGMCASARSRQRVQATYQRGAAGLKAVEGVAVAGQLGAFGGGGLRARATEHPCVGACARARWNSE